MWLFPGAALHCQCYTLTSVITQHWWGRSRGVLKGRGVHHHLGHLQHFQCNSFSKHVKSMCSYDAVNYWWHYSKTGGGGVEMHSLFPQWACVGRIAVMYRWGHCQCRNYTVLTGIDFLKKCHKYWITLRNFRSPLSAAEDVPSRIWELLVPKHR